MPFPHFTATFVGCLEIAEGMLLIEGLMAVPFVLEVIVAMLSTKFVIPRNLASAAGSSTGGDPACP